MCVQSVRLGSLVQAVSSHVTVQVEGHVTPGLETADSDVLRVCMEINASWVRQNKQYKDFTIDFFQTAL